MHFTLIRHGDYLPGTYTLGLAGVVQMQRMAVNLREISALTRKVYCANSPRAIHSAQIISEELNLWMEDPHELSYLWSGADGLWEADRPDLQAHYFDDFESLIGRQAIDRQLDHLIAVSHLEVVERFPAYLYERQFKCTINPGSIERGQAFHIDLRTGDWKLFK